MTIDAEEIGRLVTMDVEALVEYIETMSSKGSAMAELGVRMGCAAAEGKPVLLSDEENTHLCRLMIVIQRLVPLIMEELGESNEGVVTAQVQFEQVLNDASERTGKPVSELRSIFFPEKG